MLLGPGFLGGTPTPSYTLKRWVLKPFLHVVVAPNTTGCYPDCPERVSKMITSWLKSCKPIDNDLATIMIVGEPASKANSRRLVAIGGKPRFIKSKKALNYSRDFKKQCPTRKELFEEDVFVAIKIYYASRRPDLDASLILDLLQDYVYPNDRLVKGQYIEWGLDRKNPRSFIVVTTLDNKDLAIQRLSELVAEEGEECDKT